MTSAGKRGNDRGDRKPVPPYPAEVAGTWQAFRVTMGTEDDGAESTDLKRPKRPRPRKNDERQ